LWQVIRLYQQQAVSASEFKSVIKWRALARARLPRVINHSSNLKLVKVTTLPADGCMVRIGQLQRIAAVCGYIPGRLELATNSGPPDGPGVVAELDNLEAESFNVVKPTSNYTAVTDETREAWLDWFREAL